VELPVHEVISGHDTTQPLHAGGPGSP
jgi:hypothetical protein